MNPFSVLIGLFVVLVGVVFLGINVGLWSSAVWAYLATLWPIVLIIIGLRFIIRNNPLFLGLTVIILLATGFLATTPLVRSERNGLRWYSHQKTEFKRQMPITDASELKLVLPGRFDVEITGEATSDVTVDLKGPEPVINSLKLERKNNRIELSVDHDMFQFFTLDNVEGTIIVPRALALSFDISGLSDIKVKNIESKLTFLSSGASHITFVSSISVDPTVEVSGAGDIRFDSCRGTAAIDMSGAATIEANHCELTDLSIDSSGGGVIKINAGTIGNLNVDASGAVKIRVPRPNGQVHEDKSGVAKIEYIN
jgi:hypothetical protein